MSCTACRRRARYEVFRRLVAEVLEVEPGASDGAESNIGPGPVTGGRQRGQRHGRRHARDAFDLGLGTRPTEPSGRLGVGARGGEQER